MNFKKYHVSKNLWSYQPDKTSVGVTLHWDGEKIVFSNTCTSSINLIFTYGTLPAGTYTLKANANHIPVNNSNVCIDLYQASPFFQKKIVNNEAVNGTISFTLTENLTDVNLRIRLEGGVNYDGFTLAPMFNEGSTPLPYEPYSSEVWHDIPYYVHDTDTDTITTLPAVLYPTAATATVGLKGNEQHTSTPSPGSPIMPQGTGERTGNLAPPLTDWVDGYITDAGIVHAPTDTNREKTSDYISVKAGAAYTFSIENGFPDSPWRAIGWYAQDKTFISRASGNSSNAIYTNAPSNAVYCRLSYRTQGRTTNPMFNLGSTALPYEPYGIKIPISSASTTTPVYLGEVQTTRRIKKYVFTGQETIAGSAVTGGWIITNLSDSINNTSGMQTAYCSHYLAKVNSALSELSNGEMCISTQYNNRINFVTTFQTSTEFGNYLSQQYAAGTPVTVWYVLANEETAVVNEPLMKIGDYADEVSGITIPTIAGANTLSIGTTLQPSEVSVNYKGWHPVADVHKRESGQWD